MLSLLTDGPEAKFVIEQWARMLVGVGVARYALIELIGPAQIGTLLGATAPVAVSGLGRLFVFPKPSGAGP